MRIIPARGLLPGDTVVRFVYGGGEEVYSAAAPRAPEVVFCEASVEPPLGHGEGGGSSGDGAAGAGGASAATSPSDGIRELFCELWTGGTTRIEVMAAGFDTLGEHVLTTERDRCTVVRTITLIPAQGAPHL